MWGSSVIVFREVLEAALIISIILAATRGVKARGWWVTGGVAIGLAGSVVVAFSAESIAGQLQGMGQEIFNAGVLIAAVFMLAWHNLWMAAHGRELADNMKTVGSHVKSGDLPIVALAAAISLAVLREGAEVVLFLNGMLMSGNPANSLLAGGLIGIGGGAVMGIALYLGLLRVPLRHFFQVTGWMIVLLASGLAASAAGFLEQADVLPVINPMLWDSTWLLDERSVAGQLAHTLLGYQSRPSGIAMLAWSLTFVTLLILMLAFKPSSANPRLAKTQAITQES